MNMGMLRNTGGKDRKMNDKKMKHFFFAYLPVIHFPVFSFRVFCVFRGLPLVAS